MKRTPFALGLSLVLLVGSAHAGVGIVRGVETMPKAERTQLTSKVATARREQPAIFAKVDGVRESVAKLDASKRGRHAIISPALVALGKEAGLPLIEKLALGTDAHPDLGANAFVAWQLGVIEALGKLREERAASALSAIFKGPETDADLVRATATALARIGTQESLEPLFAAPAEKRLVAFSALGDARKEASAKFLVAELDRAGDTESKRTLVEALGRLGSSWAWSTPALVATGEADRVRHAIAEALVRTAAKSPDLKSDLEMALAMVEHPDTRKLISAEKSRADVNGQRSLDAIKIAF